MFGSFGVVLKSLDFKWLGSLGEVQIKHKFKHYMCQCLFFLELTTIALAAGGREEMREHKLI